MKKIIKVFFLSVLIIIIAMLLIRVLISTDKSIYDELKIDTLLAEAYAANDTIAIKTLDLKNRQSERGYFCAYSVYYIPETCEVQVTVRYNISACNYTDTENDEDFVFRLHNETKSEYYTPDTVEKSSRFMYRYRKLIFRNVKSDPTDALNVVMGVDSAEYDKQSVHYKDQEYEEYKLSRSEKKELEKLQLQQNEK